MYRKYHGFLHVLHFQFSKQINQKQWYLHCFDKTTCKKQRCFGTIFRIFSARACQVNNQSFFAAFLPPPIRTQEDVKSPKIAKLHLNLTFCLSQSLPQSCNTKNYRRLSGASKYCKLRCLKLTVLVPPERHALLHLRCGRISTLFLEVYHGKSFSLHHSQGPKQRPHAAPCRGHHQCGRSGNEWSQRRRAVQRPQGGCGRRDFWKWQLAKVSQLFCLQKLCYIIELIFQISFNHWQLESYSAYS